MSDEANREQKFAWEDPELMEEMAARLEAWPSNGKPPNDDTTTWLVVAGFVQNHQVTKPCRECGTSRHDYSFMKPTPSGRLFLAAMRRILTEGTDHAR